MLKGEWLSLTNFLRHQGQGPNVTSHVIMTRIYWNHYLPSHIGNAQSTGHNTLEEKMINIENNGTTINLTYYWRRQLDLSLQYILHLTNSLNWINRVTYRNSNQKKVQLNIHMYCTEYKESNMD